MFVRIEIVNPFDWYGMIYYEHVFDIKKWRGLRPGINNFDCEDSELPEIYYQASQLGLTVTHSPCGP